MLIDYSELPDSMSTDEVETHLNNFLDAVQQQPNMDLRVVAKALYELADRQWHTYATLNAVTRIRVDEYVYHILWGQAWRAMPVTILRSILSVIGNIGLVKSYEFVKGTVLSQETDLSFEDEINQFISEIDRKNKGQIEDPYLSV